MTQEKAIELALAGHNIFLTEEHGVRIKIKELIKKFIEWRFKCTHNDYMIIFKDHQERCEKCRCANCGETFLEDM